MAKKSNPISATVVIPVYADWASLEDCIESLKEHLDTKHSVKLVNDNGPDADDLERKINRAISQHENFEYFRNPNNLGFLKTCNRAVFELDKTNNNILLLNSDTKVTAGFLEEMSEVLNSESKIGAVSPRSNNATICTIPLSSMAQKGIEPEKSYQLFLKLKEKLPRYNEVPTAHGFCMLVKRSLIKKYGLFDEVFGNGYGEENDFCMRIAKQGYSSVLANRAYVYHLEARSFTLEKKTKLIENNSKILLNRWPSYKNDVTAYIEEALAREEGVEPGSKLARRAKLLKREVFSRLGR